MLTLEQLKEKLKPEDYTIDLNDGQWNTVHEYLASIEDSDEQKRDIEILQSALAENAKDAIIENIIIPFNINKMTADIKRRIHEEGDVMYMYVNGVMVYSIGNSVNNANDPHELLSGPITFSNRISLLQYIGHVFPGGNYPEGTFQLQDYAADSKGSPLRIRFDNIPNPLEVKEQLFPRIDTLHDVNVTKLYFVTISDKNGKMPGEEGYIDYAPNTLEAVISAYQ